MWAKDATYVGEQKEGKPGEETVNYQCISRQNVVTKRNGRRWEGSSHRPRFEYFLRDHSLITQIPFPGHEHNGGNSRENERLTWHILSALGKQGVREKTED